MTDLLVGFYGDDFTGSAGVMEVLAAAGVKTVLFLDPPSDTALTRFPGVRAVGIAGMSRTASPEEMERILPPVFESLRALGPALVHYKICSTFDSSPRIGSIGRALEIGQRCLEATRVPIIVGAPALGRYCLFGQLFVKAGAEVLRLDRHPTMRAHPVTPMDESDLRVHLKRQTDRRVELMDLVQLSGTDAEVDARFQSVVADGPDAVLFDVLDESRLRQVGRLLLEHKPRLVIGSQGVEYALVAHLGAASVRPRIDPVDRLLVVSGSCSPETDAQIGWALEHGFAGLPGEQPGLVDRAVALLAEGRSVVIHSARGPTDPRVVRGRSVGEGLGQATRAILDRQKVTRVLFAGGDTSGHGTRALGIEALEWLASPAPGTTVCRAHGANIDGLQLVLKGGQMGPVDLFEKVKTGGDA